MAKKKPKRQCFSCNGSGLKCNRCGEPESICDGCGCSDDGDEAAGHSDCEECLGTGIAFADITQADLTPDRVAKWTKLKQ